MKYFAADMPDGKRYGIPVEVIAKDCAQYYARYHGEDYQENFDTMMNWFDTGNFEFADWAINSMNWDDVKDIAVVLSEDDEPCDYEEGWLNGDYSYIEVVE